MGVSSVVPRPELVNLAPSWDWIVAIDEQTGVVDQRRVAVLATSTQRAVEDGS
jgi:hypothetical protein